MEKLKRAVSLLAMVLVGLTFGGVGVAQAAPHQSNPHGVPGVSAGGAKTALAGGPHYYAGYRHTLDVGEQAAAQGATVKMQAWSATTPADGTKQNFGELSVQNSNAIVEIGYMNRWNSSLPQLFVNGWNGSTSFGINTGFTACTSTAVAGCAKPAWILPGANVSNSGQYQIKWWYTHVGFADGSEGWWASVVPSGGVPTGKQEWIGYYKKSAKWPGVTASGVTVTQVFGEAYDESTPPTVAMGTGSCPNGSGGGALFNLYDLVPSSTATFTSNVTSDPTYYNVAEGGVDTNLFRYGGRTDTGAPGC